MEEKVEEPKVTKEVIEENLKRVENGKALTIPLIILNGKFKRRYYNKSRTAYNREYHRQWRKKNRKAYDKYHREYQRKRKLINK